MMKTFRLLLIAAALGAPVMLTAPAGATSANSPSAPFEEVAAARNNTQARAQQRQRRPSAQRQRRQRQAATRPRRSRATQG